MLKSEVVGYFGGIVKTADAVGITHVSVSDWGEIIPEAMAARLEKITNGKLVYDHEFYMSLKKRKKQAA